MNFTDNPLITSVVTTHAITELDRKLQIHTMGNPGPNGDFHHYLVSGREPGDFSYSIQDENGVTRLQADQLHLKFQQGNPANGFNGLTLEVLLSICMDRLEGCQTGPFASEHNALALQHLGIALEHLHNRTREKEA